MEIHELVIEMKLLERRLTLYEEKYGVLSEDFYNALMSGKLADYDAYDETRTDFSRWKGLYETWLGRKKAYIDMTTSHIQMTQVYHQHFLTITMCSTQSPPLVRGRSLLPSYS